MNEKGYILLSRAILDSDVFASQKLLKIWIWCLCKANFKDRALTHLRGNSEQIVKCKRGQFIFGRYKAEEELMIDGSTIYKSIKKLEKMEMIKIDSNKSFSIITICNYDTYQDNNTYKVAREEQESTHRVPTEYPQSNTTNTLPNANNDKKDKNIPTYEDFKKYAIEKTVRVKRQLDESKLILKYDAWVENGWKDGNDTPIKNWKSKLNQTLQYLFLDKNQNNINPKELMDNDY